MRQIQRQQRGTSGRTGGATTFGQPSVASTAPVGAAVATLVACALIVLPISNASALSASEECRSQRRSAHVTLGTASSIAVAATTMELKGIQRESGWRIAKEPDRSAVFVDPSSHLHALGTYYLAKSAASSFVAVACGEQGSRRSMQHAALKGAAVAMTIGVAKEVVDGWYNGFSSVDLAVDGLGAGFAVAQSYIEPLRHVTPSISVAPGALSNSGARRAAFDYAHQTMWLSANVHEMLPSSVSKAWPAAVRLSAGRRAQSGGVANEFIVGLDLDAAALPGNNAHWVKVKRALHNVRLPGPAIVMSGNGTKAVGLYW